MIRSSTRLRCSLASAAAIALASVFVGACSSGPASVVPLPIAHDASQLGFADSRPDVLKPAPASTEFFNGISPGGAPRGIARGTSGMWFTEVNADKIGRISPGGAVTEFSGLSAGSAPNNIVQGSDGNFWFTESSADQIGRINSRGKIKFFAAGNEAYGPFDITSGPDGSLWFTYRSPSFNAIGRMTTAGVVTLFTSGLSQGDPAVHDITNGPDGNVWFTEEFGNRIGRITPSGAISEFSVGITANANVADITTGPDGNLWFTENGIDRIGRITPAGVVTEFFNGITPGSGPGSITAAKGFVWFTEVGGSRIGRVSMTGKITEFPIAGSLSSDIASGLPQNDLWITDLAGNGIVRVTE
jgi:streptogramin lyase